jgi:hypothetical protein
LLQEVQVNFKEDSILPLATTDCSPRQDSQGNNNDKGSNDNIQHTPLCQEIQNGEGGEFGRQEWSAPPWAEGGFTVWARTCLGSQRRVKPWSTEHLKLASFCNAPASQILFQL